MAPYLETYSPQEDYLSQFDVKKKIWIIVSADTRKGIKKWKVKNRVRVGLSTANPPQSQETKEEPTYGIAEKRLVITVAPQNDICPHGSTWPKKADAITNNKSKTPINQTPMYI